MVRRDYYVMLSDHAGLLWVYRERGGRDQGGWRSSPQPQGWGTRSPADRDLHP